MTPEVLRLCKLAYPDFGHNARNRLAVKALINTINDRDAIFYIKDKNPTSLDEVCSMYEKYRVLTGSNHPKPAVKGVKSSDDDSQRQHSQQSTKKDELLTPLLQQQEATAKLLQQLTESVNKLLHEKPTTPSPTPPVVKNSLSAMAPAFQPAADQGQIPRKPCPRCHQHGHWARDCPQRAQQHPAQQYHPGNSFANQPLNTSGPMSAPDMWSNAQRLHH